MGRVDVPLDGGIRPDDVSRAAEASGLDVVIVRYPAVEVDWFDRLRSDRYIAVHADSLLYFEKDLTSGSWDAGSVAARAVRTESDRRTVRNLAHSSFPEYRSHYFANPLFDRSLIAAGYAEWASRFWDDGCGDSEAFLATSGDGEVVGFAAVQYEPVAEFALVAVAPWASGRRLYGEILRGVEPTLAGRGVTGCVISTQVHNIPVLRTVTRLGYRPILSLQTVHLVRAQLLEDRG